MTTEGQVTLPSQFGRYTLIERLAVGGMAEVFRAKIVSSHGFEKVIVIKRILPNLAADPNFVTMFIDEAKLTAQLSHPKIVQLLDFGEVSGQYFIALEFIDGFDALALLRAAAHKRVRVPLSLVVFVLAEVLDALDYAHTALDMSGAPMNLVHRDISPSNIFISRHGDVKLGDFGIAHAGERRSQETQTGTLKGKYGYMSPEQVVGGSLDARSDLFAVGIVLAEAFMGRRLFTARNDLDVLLMVRDARLERLNRYGHDIPPDLDRIVRRALKRDLGARYQTAGEFRDDLSDYLIAHKLRVGAADLRAFTHDLFDGSPEALGRIQAQGRRISEPPLEAPAPRTPSPARGSGEPAGPSGAPAESSPGPLVVMELDAPPDGGGGLVPPLASPTPAPAPPHTAPHGPPGPAPASAPAPPARAAEVAAVPEPRPPGGTDSRRLAPGTGGDPVTGAGDQWGSTEVQSSARQTGWTPISEKRPGVLGARSTERGPRPGRSNLGRFVSAVPARAPDRQGELANTSPLRVFADVTIAGESGLLRFDRPSAQPAGEPEVKEVYLAKGSPESVDSSVPEERFGAYLVARGVLRAAELEMALGMLPHFSGKLGDTLVGLGLMRTLDVFRQLSQQVRDRVLDLFRWSTGRYAFFRGLTNQRDSFPLGLDGFEMLGAGALTIPTDDLERRFEGRTEARPRRTARAAPDPDTFRLGPMPREILDRLDGERALGTLLHELGEHSADDRLSFLRSLHLLVEANLVELT